MEYKWSGPVPMTAQAFSDMDEEAAKKPARPSWAEKPTLFLEKKKSRYLPLI